MTVGALTAIVVHVLWLTITIFGTVATFNECRVSPLGCVGGVVGLLSAATAAVGVVAAIGVLRRDERQTRRGVSFVWLTVAAVVVLTFIMAGFGGAASG